MANIKHFFDSANRMVALVGNIQGMRNAEFAARFPGVKGKRLDSFTMQVMSAGDRELFPVTRAIERKSNPSNHKCDARCLNATGFKCECECGGKNHGAGNFICEALAA